MIMCCSSFESNMPYWSSMTMMESGRSSVGIHTPQSRMVRPSPRRPRGDSDAWFHVMDIQMKGVAMNISQIYIAVSIIALAIVAFLVFFVSKNRKENRLTPLASLASTFTVLGIVFSDDRLIGYGLMGVGVLLAIVDMYNRSKQK